MAKSINPSDILSEVVYLRTYARWLDTENRRETWPETVNRYMCFMRDQLGKQLSESLYKDIHQAILSKSVMPSMRLMQFAGPTAARNNVYAYNCAYIAPTCLKDFAEIMYISMCGCGVGFSVESQSVQLLPIIKKQTGRNLATHQIADDKEGWCHAFTTGLETWFSGKDIDFDFSKLRPFGARLKFSGGTSSGPDPLRALLEFTRAKILSKQGRRLENIDVYDILCKIGEIVVSGGVRRSALISLSDLDDQAMRDAKQGSFYLTEPQRSYSNNSAVYESQPEDATLLKEWLALQQSGTGERGIFNRGELLQQLPSRRIAYFKKAKFIKHDKLVGQIGCNPCGEIILQSKQFCNLSEVIARPDDTLKSLLHKTKIAALLGTFQATLTQFEFLSADWKKHCRDEALLGVSITGQWDCALARDAKVLQRLKKQAIQVNQRYAKRFGINPATAVTCIKPSGNVSQVTNCASGMHPRFAKYYIRRVRIAKSDALARLLIDQGVPYHPEVGYAADNTPTYVFDFPIAAPTTAVTRDELSALDQLEHWKLLKSNFTEHNPSVTISISDDEWIDVLQWLKQNWNIIGGLSFLSKQHDVYKLAPYQKITRQQYLLLKKMYQHVDFSKLPQYENGPSAGLYSDSPC